MNRAGCFTEDIAQEHGEVNISEELYVEGEGCSARRADELREKEDKIWEEQLRDMEEQVDDMMVREPFITPFDAHKA